ncbi:MAG: YacL family protein [Nitrosomonas sp.]|nr:YacL family protein [Nitrosomonas sp.]
MTENDFTWPGRIYGDPAHDLIIAYLTIDIQQSPKWTEELLQQIELVKSGQIPSWERTGNAYYLHIYPDHVEIEDDYTEDNEKRLKVTFQDFSKAIKAWQTFIQKTNKK